MEFLHNKLNCYGNAIPLVQKPHKRLVCFDSANLKLWREIDASDSASASASARANAKNIAQAQFKDFPKFPSAPNSTEGSAKLNCLDFDKVDQDYLLAGSNSGAVKFWNVSEIDDNGNFSKLAQIKEHVYGVSSLNWWPFDTGLFVSSSFDKTIKMWDTETLSVSHVLENRKIVPRITSSAGYTSGPTDESTDSLVGQVYTCDFSPTKQHSMFAVASRGNGYIKVIDIRSMNVVSFLFGHASKSVLSAKWNPRQPYILASGGIEGDVKVWDIRTNRKCLYTLKETTRNSQNWTLESNKAHRGAVNGLCWTENGDKLVSVGLDNCVKCWDMNAKIGKVVHPRAKNAKITKRVAKNDQNHISNTFLQTINPVVCEGDIVYPSKDLFVFDLESLETRKDEKSVKRYQRSDLLVPPDNSYCCVATDGERFAVGTTNGDLDTWGYIPSNLV